MSKNTAGRGAKRALKPIVAYAWIQPAEGGPPHRPLFFRTLGDARGFRGKSGGPIQKLISVPIKYQVALTRAIARKHQIQIILNDLERISDAPGATKAGRNFRKTMAELLHIRRKEIAFEEGLADDGQPL